MSSAQVFRIDRHQHHAAARWCRENGVQAAITDVVAVSDADAAKRFAGAFSLSPAALHLAAPAEAELALALMREGTKRILVVADWLDAARSMARLRCNADLIYSDPMWGTGQDFLLNGKLAYADRLTGSTHLAFLRERLLASRAILARHGTIYLHLDHRSVHSAKVVMDSIFRAENFRNHVVRLRSNPKSGSQVGFPNSVDHILRYSRSDRFTWHPARKPVTEADNARLTVGVKDGRRYMTEPLHLKSEVRNGQTGEPWRGIPPPKGRHWRWRRERLEAADRAGLIDWSTRVPRLIRWIDERKGQKRQDVILDCKDPCKRQYPGQKSLKLLIMWCSRPQTLAIWCSILAPEVERHFSLRSSADARGSASTPPRSLSK